MKLANELKRTREIAVPLEEQQQYYNRNWYEGGLWRAPAVLPGVDAPTNLHQPYHPVPALESQPQVPPLHSLHLAASPISLSDLFFSLVVVTAFTRVGVGVSQTGYLRVSHLLYFAVFWTVWSKEASYSTRFDTTDLSASVTTLVTCFAVLFACLSAQAPIATEDGTRIMAMAAAVAILHAFLHIRVALTTCPPNTVSNSTEMEDNDNDVDDPLAKHIRAYATFHIAANVAEATVWLLGIFVVPTEWEHRWIVVLLGVLLALRVPRAFLSNDFHGALACLVFYVTPHRACYSHLDSHMLVFPLFPVPAACSKRGVLFILLLGFLLQSIVVVASEFFEYQTPRIEDYAFLGSACLMFFCIKLLYVDDTTNRAEDHALLVNRWAGFFFNLGNFSLLLSTTVMGSGLNLLTHSYFAATAALPGPAKNLVCGGFSAALFSTLFIKSMHLKRVPTDPRHRALFVSAYIIQSLVLLGVVIVTATMCLASNDLGGFLGYLMNSDIQLLFALSGAALFVVIMSWLDEGVELALYGSSTDSKAFRIAPFGFWGCLTPEVSDAEVLAAEAAAATANSTARSLSALSPLLGSSVADLKRTVAGYDSVSSGLGAV